MYDVNCSHCNHQPEHLNLANNSKFKSLLTSVEKAFKKLHSKGSYTPEDLSSTPEYVQVIIETNKILGRALVDNDLSEGMLNRLQNDTFIFSGIKAHAELLEASKQLLTEDKTIKPFDIWSNDVKGVKDSHRKYLEAEYDFAVGSVQMAERWESFNDSDRYNLQYRTASDDKVRASHADLHNTTLPKKHPFWNAYFPPNGWRCRCTTVEVLAYLDEATDGEAAMKAGKKATTQINKNGTNKLAIFRFNAGKKGKVFPPKHPYNKVSGAEKVKPIIIDRINNDKNKVLLKRTYKSVRKKMTGTINTNRFGKVLINKKSFDKTQNINSGSYQNQIDSLQEFTHLKNHLNDYKGEISIIKTKNLDKRKRKPNIIGYVEISTKKGDFSIGLEKDKAVSEDYKLYYIKKSD